MNFVSPVAATSSSRATPWIVLLSSVLLATSGFSFAGTQTVTTTADSGAGSLRQAIANAISGDTIQFQFQSTPVTISLTSGDLQISKNLTITGLGATSLIIDASSNTSQSRVFTIVSGATVSISGLTAQNGRGGRVGSGSINGEGGGIYNSGNLTLTNVVVSSNTASNLQPGGGGIFNEGTLAVNGSTISNNTAGSKTTLGPNGDVSGGGIRNASIGTLTVTNSTISGNFGQVGGGIFNTGSMTVSGTTFASNIAGVGISTINALEGGGIYINGPGSGSIVNSTFSGNSAVNDGGAIANHGLVSVSFSTFSGNSATNGANVSAIGQTLTLKANIFSNNNTNCLISGGVIVSDGDNLATDASCNLGATGDLPNTPAGLDPSGLQSNGGSTQTIALLSNSAALDKIPTPCTDAGGNSVGTDQRGTARPQGTNCDIGAFELDQSSSLVVTNTNDTGAGSLRQAIANANADSNPSDTITFNLTYPATITLTSGVLMIQKDLTIRGPGASSLTISGGSSSSCFISNGIKECTPPSGGSQIFDIVSGVSASITGISLQNGMNDNGGALINNGTLNLSDCVITNNQSIQGGGINNQSGGILNVTNSTVSANSASVEGGGLFNAGTATISNSTFSNNTALGAAAILNTTGTLTVVNSTFWGNQGTSGPGAVESGGTLHLSNSTFGNNAAGSSSGAGAIQVDGGALTIKATLLAKGSLGENCINLATVTTQGFNFSDDNSCTDLNDQTDKNSIPLQLDSAGLQDNGGPTQTVALRANSPALDAIPTASCTDVDGNTLNTDQRGTARPQDAGCDSGAFELVLSAPTIASFTPGTGDTGTPVTITGTGFTAASTVAFNNTSATTVSVDSDTQITATVPSGTTTGAISVTTAAGTATSSTNFTVTLSVTGFSPSSGPAGTSVTITGTGFTGATAVTFNGTGATFTFNSDTQITATVPSGATTGPISVTAAGTAPSASNFTVIPSPAITSFNPTSGPVGTSVTITGTAFTGVTAVTFNGVGATFTFNSDTQITAAVPSGASTGPVAVTTPGGTSQSSTSFTVIPAPTITGFTPASGGVGASVTITGTAFTGASLVSFNNTSASFTVNSDIQITATVPSGATSGLISVTTPGGTATSSSSFTVVANLPPTITGFSPSSGGIGTSVAISGANLKTATQVTFNGTNATFKLSGMKLIATVPAGATSGPISVTTPGGVANSPGVFTVVQAPTVTGFTPASGPVGTPVTITGTNFTNVTSVMFGSKTAGFTVNSATQITATVPKGAKTGRISVTTPGGTATSSTNFTVN